MYEKVENCPICSNSDFKNYIVCKDYLVSDESFVITQCTQCDFLLTNPRPSQEEIGKYYQSEAYISHSSTKKGLQNKLYHFVRQRALKKKLQLVTRLNQSKTGSILDVGCGTGHFLQTCKKKGWKIDGIEVDSNTNKRAQEILQQPIHPSLSDITNRSYDIITLWHVLEHVHDLNSYIESIKTLLSPKGHLIVAVPNHNSFDRQHYKEYWAAYDLPRHLYHFTQSTMKALMKKHGLKIKDTLPMKYDAHYVSLLSEKYISGKSSYLRAYKMGKKSNQWAKEHNNDYSSLIYIIKP